jgi:phosphoserine aminotransferase
LSPGAGLAGAERRNIAKAAQLYDFLDSGDFYANPVAKRGLVELKGQRSVGGMRASLYNAMSLAGVQALVEYLAGFADRKG